MAPSAVKILGIFLVAFAVGVSASRSAPERTLLQSSGCVDVLDNVLSNDNILSGNCIQVLDGTALNLLSLVLGEPVSQGYACPAKAETGPAKASGGNNCQCTFVSFSGLNAAVLSQLVNVLGLQGNNIFYNCNQN
jgi:hypothetical protein